MMRLQRGANVVETVARYGEGAFSQVYEE